MIRLWSDSKGNRTGYEQAGEILGVSLLFKEQEESPVFILPVPIQLDQEPMRLCTINEVIMEPGCVDQERGDEL